MFPLQERRTEAATWRRCPACGREKAEFDDDTDPGGYHLTHKHDCPWLRANRASMYHEVRFVERPELVEAVEKILAMGAGFKVMVPATTYSDWANRTALALLDAIDVRVRHRPTKKPGGA